ncbi:DUF6355 family natural product biosynthesis protein [Nocardia sp. NPDC051052]|uniref:DUF6355 family natural product biosynthesis protein n=1 Tax=Nocardia sp. NPDC051052 TaxID=3364322 RepID=UPI003793BFC5
MIVGLIIMAAGLGGSVGVASAEAIPANGFRAASACGFHEESGGALWWNNCGDQDITINITRPWFPDQTYCVPAHKDEWVTSSHEGDAYPVGCADGLEYVHDGC